MKTRSTSLLVFAIAAGAMIALAGGGFVPGLAARMAAAQEPAKDQNAAPVPKAADASTVNAKGADGWGSLKGRFVYDGAVPAPVKLNAAGQQFCGQFRLVAENLVVSPKGGIANVVVWLRGNKAKVNPKFEQSRSDKVVLDNRNCRFVPHVVGLRVGQTLVITNSDPVAHDANIDGSSTKSNWLLPAGTSIDQAIAGAEILPAPVNDSVNGLMQAWMVVRPNPYFAFSDTNGNFDIKDLPAGEWEFQVWQEKSGYVTNVTVGGQEVKWAKGRVKWTIDANKTTDLGEMKLGAAQFNK
jgi:hypothetical protein